MTIRPLSDRVVLKMTEAEESTASGIILSAKSKEKPQVAEVISVGPGGVVDGEKVEMTVKIGENEEYIINRLEREKRCGEVEIIDEHTVKFTAEVFDASEMLPWLRTFICRVSEFKSSNKQAERAFWNDLDKMYELYDIKEG